MPVALKTTHTSKARNAGRPIRAVAGIWMNGMMPGILQMKMNRNIERRNGVHPRPERPIVSMMMLRSTNSTSTSARLRTPRGALRPSWRSASRKISDPMSAAAMPINTTLLMPGTTSFQRRIVLIGGKLKPLLWSAAGLSDSSRAATAIASSVACTMVVLCQSAGDGSESGAFAAGLRPGNASDSET